MSLAPKIELIGRHLLCRNVFLDEAQKLAVLDALRAAVDEEREACAKIADGQSGGVGGMSAAIVAQRIRARDNLE